MEHSHTGYDVLIVEDNVDQANLTKLLLEEYGISAECETNSLHALETIRADNPRIVIIDLMMPELDGFRLTQQIKNSPAGARTRIIIYSGKMYDSDRRKAIELGADAFFIKPARANLLITKIKELLQPVANGTYTN